MEDPLWILQRTAGHYNEENGFDMAKNETTTEAAPQKPKGSLVKKLMVLAVVGLIIMLECVVTYFVLPSRNEVAAHYEEAAAVEDEATPDEQENEDQPKDEKESAEIDLGNYSITAHEPTANVTLRIEFHLYGTVDKKDVETFTPLYTRNEHRFRDRVIFEIRSAELTDLTDPSLGLIKRRILEKSNDLFGKQVIKSIVFSDFSFVEQ